MNPLNYIHKSPHRNQLEKYFQTFLPKLEGPILDIGSKNRRYDRLLSQRPTAIDIAENKEKEVERGDITSLPFDDKSFRSVICLEVLEYVYETDKAVREVSRVLFDNGTFVFSTPFIYSAHMDMVRYTKLGLSEVLSKYFTHFEIYPVGNFYTIILDIVRGQIIKIKFLPLRYFYYILYFPLVLLIPLFKISKDKNYVSGYFVIAKK